MGGVGVDVGVGDGTGEVWKGGCLEGEFRHSGNFFREKKSLVGEFFWAPSRYKKKCRHGEKKILPKFFGPTYLYSSFCSSSSSHAPPCSCSSSFAPPHPFHSSSLLLPFLSLS